MAVLPSPAFTDTFLRYPWSSRFGCYGILVFWCFGVLVFWYFGILVTFVAVLLVRRPAGLPIGLGSIQVRIG
jgi:hypothetical protein